MQRLDHKVDRLVHIIINGEEIITTVDHLFYVKGRGFIEAGNLLVGDKLVSVNGENLVIEKFYIEETENPVDVYNFQVKDNHTYYVGCQSILVHNAEKYSTNITPEMEKKILEGQRVGTTNRVKGGHSPTINDANPNYAVETLRNNPDGTTSVKYVKLLSDGNISKIKKSTLFPDSWSDSQILDSIKSVGDGSPLGVRSSDGAFFYRGSVDGVEIEVIKVGNDVIAGYPTGGSNTGLPNDFIIK